MAFPRAKARVLGLALAGGLMMAAAAISATSVSPALSTIGDWLSRAVAPSPEPIVARSAEVARSGDSSGMQVAATISTDKTGYLAGETVAISGSGFAAGEAVALQIAGSSGPLVNASQVADGSGSISAAWTLAEGAGNSFTLSAAGATTGPVPDVPFNRIAVVGTDKYDYLPGETAIITGAGFKAGESVTVQVVHSNGLDTGAGHLPFPVVADVDGSINTPWFVNPDDSEGAIFRLTATGPQSGLIATSTFTDVLVSFIDDDGPDDEPGQKDLNAMSSDLGAAAIAITWNWDDTDAGGLGGNTNDACALVDTNLNGFANFAFCVVSDGDPTRQIGNVLYSCNDTRSDRCAGPTLLSSATGNPATLPAPRSSTSNASVVANTDPFRLPPFNAAHSAGNDCDADANCLTADTVANVTLQLSDVGGAAVAKLINVCSYPSQEPNSDPSDCVITPDSGFLTIVKNASPSDSTAFRFDLGAGQASQTNVNNWTINGSGSVSLITMAPGTTYDLNEAVPAGWKLTNVSCVIQNAAGAVTGTPDAPPDQVGPTSKGVQNFEIKSGLETVCTFTDAKLQGSIQIVKNTVGGLVGQNYQFDFTPVGFNSGSTISLTTTGVDDTEASTTFGGLAPGGTFSVSETGSPTGWDQTSAVCAIEGTTVTGPTNIEVQNDKTTICTFTNTENTARTRGKIVISKVTNPASDTTTEFTFSRDYQSPTFTLVGGANETASALTPGTFTVSEGTLPTGWKFTNVICTVTRTDPTDPNQTTTSTTTPSGPQGVSITVAAGDTVSCAFTNTKDATLKVIKHVVNDNGGTALASAWTMNVTATNPSSATFAGAESPGVTITLNAGAFSVVESGGPASGYTQTSAVDCSGTAVAGGSYTCTITNDDVAPSLTLNKVLVKNNGGTAAESDWALTANGGAAGTLTGPGAAGAADVVSAATFLAGTYTLSESAGPAGYTASTWSCTGTGTFSAVGPTITLAVGQSAVCEITNNDAAPSLTLNKVLVKNNGGTAAESDWALTANGGAAGTLTGPGAVGAADVVSAATFLAGTYTLSESAGPAGYTASTWSCTGTGTFSAVGPTITLTAGQSAVCEITNNDVAPSLTLSKAVLNNSGGSATPAAFTLTADGGGAGALVGVGPNVVSGATFQAGTYALSETGPSGYSSALGYTCQKNGGPLTASTGIQLSVGDSAVCRIINDDIPAKLTVNKVCLPTTDAGKFNLLIDGIGSTDTACGGTYERFVNAGTHTVSEAAGTGTVLTDYVTAINGACAANGTITLGLGGSATCTITNTKKGMVEVKKITNGGVHPAMDIKFTLYQTVNNPLKLDGEVALETLSTLNDADGILQFTSKLVPATNYTICENPVPAGWTSLWMIGFTLNGQIVTPYNPNALDVPAQDLGVRCFNFTVTAAQTAQFEVHNDFPGGDPRTIGYWKNWNRCTGGGQATNADRNGGTAAGFYLLENVLPQILGDLTVTTCAQGVKILSKQDLDAKNRASDAAYELAAQFLATRANLAVGATTCGAVQTAVVQAQALLDLINFTGTGAYLPSNVKTATLIARRNLALQLANTLDQYNNGNLCP